MALKVTKRGRFVHEQMDLCGWGAVEDSQGRIYKLLIGVETYSKTKFATKQIRENGALARNKTIFDMDGSVQAVEGRFTDE